MNTALPKSYDVVQMCEITVDTLSTII